MNTPAPDSSTAGNPGKSFWRTIWVVGRILLLSYVGLVAFLYLNQRNMIFMPSRYTAQQGESLAATRGLAAWEEDGTFHGWKDAADGESAVLIFHGNAGAAVHRDYLRDLFRGPGHGVSGISVYIFEYPGFGFRDGKPGEKAFREAAAEAYSALAARYASIYLLGESIGGGTATWLAAEKDPQGLLLITPFNRLAAVASAHYPWIPVRHLLRDQFRNDLHLQKYEGPVAFVVAGRDEVVPSRFARKLYESYEGPKLWELQDQASHNSMMYDPGSELWSGVLDFLFDR